jgi:hypothetical protein
MGTVELVPARVAIAGSAVGEFDFNAAEMYSAFFEIGAAAASILAHHQHLPKKGEASGWRAKSSAKLLVLGLLLKFRDCRV